LRHDRLQNVGSCTTRLSVAGLRRRASEAEHGLFLDLQNASGSAVKAAAKDETGYLDFEIHGRILAERRPTHACGRMWS
jgi:hypothetical protein